MSLPLDLCVKVEFRAWRRRCHHRASGIQVTTTSPSGDVFFPAVDEDAKIRRWVLVCTRAHTYCLAVIMHEHLSKEAGDEGSRTYTIRVWADFVEVVTITCRIKKMVVNCILFLRTQYTVDQLGDTKKFCIVLYQDNQFQLVLWTRE